MDIYYKTKYGVLYNGDCFEVMETLNDNIIDAIIVDPPYGKTLCEWDSIIPVDKMWEAIKRIRKDNTPILIFGTEPFSSHLRLSNIAEYRYDWIWDKKIPSGMNYAKNQPMRQHEIISVFYKKSCRYEPQMIKREKPIKGGGMGNSKSAVTTGYKALKKTYEYKYPTSIIQFLKVRNGSVHPTQKPLELLEYILKTYTGEWDLVLDFAAGSGTTLVACEKLKRRWIGIEINKSYCDIIVSRLKDTF